LGILQGRAHRLGADAIVLSGEPPPKGQKTRIGIVPPDEVQYYLTAVAIRYAEGDRK
jgi:hypothetical protein